ncbi:D-2-hydroxyacid dehydrogenase [Lactobacillus apis]|uniref:Putative glycerate dehydrogenase n=1 Tax=Lactobacillus apis TaxID=303541 RepID=A0A0F4LUJ2_9LACO|nr:D-2-hydroxyacid dehydrogenase [Lactobacillus apis]KJY62038.1 putative glycerate dehydrogenase [Lactobacillus apis]MBC6362065.1 D-2-hydroxyacid dehydrogenase [Lactobacillus apis]
MKIVNLDSYALNPGDLDWSPLKELGDCTFYDRTPVNDDNEILKRIGDAEIVLTNKTPLDEHVISTAPNLKYIGVTATGYNVIDTEAATKANIPVTNIPTYGTDAVAQFTFALLLEITSHVGLHNQLVHDGRWSSNPDFTFWAKPLMELQGKTLGLIGFGSIAKKVAEIGHAFSMNIIFYNHRPKTDLPNYVKQVSLEELYQQSDIISLHVPQTPETTEMINQEAISQMKDGVILINTARGGLISEKDVADALNDGKIAAAGVDVVQKEPIPTDSPLLSAKNCYITPHIAWAPRETRNRLLGIVVDNLQAFLNGEKLNVVN